MKLTKKQQRLVEDNMKLVYFIVNNKLRISGEEYEDVAQIGMVGLCKAVAAFDESKGLNFSTFASKCIINEILMFYRKYNKDVQLLSLEGAIFDVDDENDESEANKLEGRLSEKKDFSEEFVNREEFAERVNILLNFLKGRERTIILFALAGYNQNQIGKYLGISRSYVSRIENKVICDLKDFDKHALKKTYFFCIEKYYYNLSFETKNAKNFNKILANLFETTSFPNSYFVDFELVCTEQSVTIKVPQYEKIFAFLALVLEKIEK